MIFFDIDETLLDQRRAELLAAEVLLSMRAEWLPAGCTAAQFCCDWRTARDQQAATNNEQPGLRWQRRRQRMQQLCARQTLSIAQLDELVALYQSHYEDSWCPFSDVAACVNRLHAWPLGIISNGSSRDQRRKLAAIHLLHRFHVIVVAEDVGVSKPRPEIFLAACREAGRAPQQCLYVGDRFEHDVAGACAIGMHGVWLDRHGTEQPQFGRRIRSLLELPALAAETLTAKAIRSGAAEADRRDAAGVALPDSAAACSGAIEQQVPL